MNKLQARVLRAEYKPNCWILASFPRKEDAEFRVKPSISFLYDAGDTAAEWEPEYGPIQIWHKCDANSEGAKEHYFYDYDNAPGGSWSQLAVERYELPQSANDGNWDYIFNVLKDWAER